MFALISQNQVACEDDRRSRLVMNQFDKSWLRGFSWRIVPAADVIEHATFQNEVEKFQWACGIP